MLNFIFDENNDLVDVTNDRDEVNAARDNDAQVLNRNNFNSLADAEAMADKATALNKELYIATDSGPCVSPRYDVVKMPELGDDVSYAFNGDSYPCGTIVAISESLRRIKVSTGRIFWRRKLSGSWVNAKTWSLIPGHVSERNPSF